MDSKLFETSVGLTEQDEEIKTLLFKYKEAALAHTDATMNPDHRKANRNHDIIMSSLAKLKEYGSALRLEPFLSHPSEGVRIWAATHLLPSELNDIAISTLKDIAVGNGFIATAAEMVLSEWSKGRLRS